MQKKKNTVHGVEKLKEDEVNSGVRRHQQREDVEHNAAERNSLSVDFIEGCKFQH